MPETPPDITPWDVLPSADGSLHVRLYEGAAWLILGALVLYGAWSAVRALRGERRLRTGRLVASAGVALVGVVCAFLLVREVDVTADATTIRWTETRLPGRVVREGTLPLANLAEVTVRSFRGRNHVYHRVVLLARDGSEHLPDEKGSDLASAEALAAYLRTRLPRPSGQ